MDPVTVLFDEHCGVCRWSAQKLRIWDRDGRLRFAGIGSAEGERLLRGLDPDTRLASWHVAADNGAVWSGGAAIPVLARRLRGGGPIASLAETFPVTADRLYRWVAAHRFVFGMVLGARACDADPIAER